MQNSTPLFPSIGALLGYPSSFILNNGKLSEDGFEISRALFLTPFLLFQSTGGGSEKEAELGMDLSKVGERILSSVRSARSLGLLPSADQASSPEIPARAAAAAAVARAIAGLPPNQQLNLPSSSEKLRSIYGSNLQEEVIEEPEEEFYEEEFDPIRRILERAPVEEDGLDFFEKQAALRLVQLDVISERLSRQVMEHRDVMVKGMNLVRELEKELNVASNICMNGRTHLISSMNEVSRDLVVNSQSKKKQVLLDIHSVLVELRHALNTQRVLESLVEDGNYCKAFQLLPEHLQLLDSFSGLSSVQELSRGVEIWLGTTLQRLDSLLLGVCHEFKDEHFLTVVDAYALIGDERGLAEKLQSFFMQEVLSETLSVLKNIVHGDVDAESQSSRLTYSDLCFQIPESKFRLCLIRTLANLFSLMCSYYKIMSFELESKDKFGRTTEKIDEAASISPSKTYYVDSETEAKSISDPVPFVVSESSSSALIPTNENISSCCISSLETVDVDSHHHDKETESNPTMLNMDPWYHLRKDATSLISQNLEHGRKIFWQLATSRVSVLLSATESSSTSVHQFLKNFEDLNAFTVAGEAFCGLEAIEFRKKIKNVCENYFASLHRQHVHALKMVLEKETWGILPLDSIRKVSFPGLIGDGAPLITSSHSTSVDAGFTLDKPINHTVKKSGFNSWLQSGNPFLLKLTHYSKEGYNEGHDGETCVEYDGESQASRSSDKISPKSSNGSLAFGDENEDLMADFIDEDSQLPSRIAGPNSGGGFARWKNQETPYQTGSSICLLRSMDKYARLMQKLELINVELFKGIFQLFEVFFYVLFETFVNSSGKGVSDVPCFKLRAALSRILQDCDQWVKPQTATLPSLNSSPFSSYMHPEVTPTSPIIVMSSGLKERCSGASTISYVAQILKSSKAHLQSMLRLKNPALVEDFYSLLVDCVPDLVSQIHKTTARIMLPMQGFADKIATSKWEPKELGIEHNPYADLILGHFKYYANKIANAGIDEKMQGVLLDCGMEVIVEVFVEGLSRVKRCTNEGRALMSLDMQVLINGLKHLVHVDVKPKFQIAETFIKAYYLPDTEFYHWPRAHPEFSKSQVTGLINLVAAMRGWKKKVKQEILEKLE